MDIKPVYLFYGEEKYLIRRDLGVFRRTFGADDGFAGTEQFDATETSLDVVLDSADQLPLFGEKRLLIVNHAPWFAAAKKDEGNKKDDRLEKERQRLLKYLDNPNENTCIVFVADSVSNNLKTTKAVAEIGKVRKYEKIKSRDLPDYLRRYAQKHGKMMNLQGINRLLQQSIDDLGVLSAEMDKLILYVGDREVITEDDVIAIGADTAEATMFQLSDAITQRRPGDVAKICRKLLDQSTYKDAVIIQGYVANHLRLLLQVQEFDNMLSPKEIGAKIGIHEYRVKKALIGARKYTAQQLIEGLGLIMEADYKVKSGVSSFERIFPVTLISIVAGAI